jgi:hypothetical protein
LHPGSFFILRDACKKFHADAFDLKRGQAEVVFVWSLRVAVLLERPFASIFEVVDRRYLSRAVVHKENIKLNN